VAIVNFFGSLEETLSQLKVCLQTLSMEKKKKKKNLDAKNGSKITLRSPLLVYH
jgi:hypothetical protein